MQTSEQRKERIDIIRQAQARYNANKDSTGLDLNNLNFVAMSDSDNEGLTVAVEVYIKDD